MDTWFTTKEAAVYARYKTDKTIRRAIQADKLEAVRRSDKHPYRIKKEWVDRWLTPTPTS